MPYIIGLNSGSSFDGIDVVLCTIELGVSHDYLLASFSVSNLKWIFSDSRIDFELFQEDDHPTPPKYVAGLTVDWPAPLRDAVIRAFENQLTIFELTRLNYAAGAVYADAVNRLLRESRLNASEIGVVGYDGQTIYQEPPDREKMAAMQAQDSLVDLWIEGGYPCGLFIAESGVVAGMLKFNDQCSCLHYILSNS